MGKIEYDENKVHAFQKKMHELMDSLIENPETAKGLYNRQTHYYLTHEENDLDYLERAIILPLDKKYWGDKFINIMDYYEKGLSWPHYSLYQYAMDIFLPPNLPISLLNFGYAMVDGKLISTTFFVVPQKIDQLVGDSIMQVPIDFVIDPFAVFHGINPDCYIGIKIPEKYIKEWYYTRSEGSPHPLEKYVSEKTEKDHQGKIFSSRMEAYKHQMAYAPDWFPQEMIDFAEKEGLPIPEQSRKDTVIGRNDDYNKSERQLKKESVRKIFIARHAEYEEKYKGEIDPEISFDGKKQTEVLVKEIKWKIGDDTQKVTIWTSTARRAVGTAKVLMKHFPWADYAEFEELWSSSERGYDLDWFNDKLKEFKEGVLIVVTHFEYAKNYPESFGVNYYPAFAQGIMMENSKFTKI